MALILCDRCLIKDDYQSMAVLFQTTGTYGTSKLNELVSVSKSRVGDVSGQNVCCLLSQTIQSSQLKPLTCNMLLKVLGNLKKMLLYTKARERDSTFTTVSLLLLFLGCPSENKNREQIMEAG